MNYKFSGSAKTLLVVFTAVVLVMACSGSGVNSTAATLALFAGNMGGLGSADGTGPAASFNRPESIASDSVGNIYVADTFNDIIRKITPAGVVTTLAGSAGVTGSSDGTGPAASFSYPSGIATDSADNIYVADAGNCTIRKISPAGVVTTLAGTAGVIGSANGTGKAASFNNPIGITIDSAGNLYVADNGNSIIRRITSAGVVTTLAGTAGVAGSIDSTGTAASFRLPRGIATDSAGNLYVTDTGNHSIRMITPAGIVTTLAGTAGVIGSADGTGAAASFNNPQGVATDSTGNIYVGDTANYSIRMITPAGVVTTLAGTAGVIGSADGTGAAASFNNPKGVATDSAGKLYVADTFNYVIRKITAVGVVTTLAGAADTTGSADGTGTSAGFKYPQGIATDGAGNVYVADTSNDTIRKITAAGVVTTLAGTTGVSGSADGTGVAANFWLSRGVATDSAGNVYVADTGNQTIRKVTPVGVVTTLAGVAGLPGSADGNGAAARFNSPQGVATDSASNVYVADTYNNIIRKITPAGIVSTLAGAAGLPGSNDGTGSAARFFSPQGISTDSAGNVYVVDGFNQTIRKITQAGVVTTLAGSAGMIGSADGIGAAARFKYPQGIATDSAGNIYVADTSNQTIRKITPSGEVSTVVGLVGLVGFTAGVLPGRLAFPRGITISGTSLYIVAQNGVAVVNNVP